MMARYRLWKPGVCAPVETIMEDMDLEYSWLGRIWSDSEEEGSRCRGRTVWAQPRSEEGCTLHWGDSWGDSGGSTQGMGGQKTDQLRQEGIIMRSLCAGHRSQPWAHSSEQTRPQPWGTHQELHQLPFSTHRDLVEKLVVRWYVPIIKREDIQINLPHPQKNPTSFIQLILAKEKEVVTSTGGNNQLCHCISLQLWVIWQDRWSKVKERRR